MAVEVTRRRFTADEYQEMGRAGILREGDRVELIDGEVLAMSPIGASHVGTLNRIAKLFFQRAGDTATVQAYWILLQRDDATSNPVLAAFGKYFDRMVKTGGKWRIAERIAHVESRQR